MRPWTRKEEELLRFWAGLRVKHEVIARRLNRTARACACRIMKLARASGVPADYRRPWGDLREAVSRLSGPGISDRDVARVLDVAKSTAATTRRRLGIPPGVGRNDCRRGWRPGDPGGLKAAVVRLYGRWGMADTEIAARTGHTRAEVWYVRTKLGLDGVGRAGRKPKEMSA